MSGTPFTAEEIAVAKTLTIDERTSRWIKPDGSEPTDRECAAAIWSLPIPAETVIASTIGLEKLLNVGAISVDKLAASTITAENVKGT